MELAFAQIIQTRTDYAVQLCAEVRETHFSRAVLTAGDPVTQYCSLTYFSFGHVARCEKLSPSNGFWKFKCTKFILIRDKPLP